jgi:hypothetical protein
MPSATLRPTDAKAPASAKAPAKPASFQDDEAGDGVGVCSLSEMAGFGFGFGFGFVSVSDVGAAVFVQTDEEEALDDQLDQLSGDDDDDTLPDPNRLERGGGDAFAETLNNIAARAKEQAALEEVRHPTPSLPSMVPAWPTRAACGFCRG